MEKQDFCIIEIAEKKHLVKFLKKEGKVFTGIIPSNHKKEKVVFKEENIIANLGAKPKYGHAYGVKVEPFIDMFDAGQIGEVHVYRKLEKEERQIIEKQLKYFGDKFVDLEYNAAFPLRIDIRHAKGKYAGWYKVNGKDQDVMTLAPKEITDIPDVRRLIAHELGHSIWAHHLKSKTKATWIELYHKGVMLETASKEEVESVVNDFCASKLFIDDFEDKEQDEKRLDIFYNMIDYVSDIHSLDQRFVDTLIKAGKDIKKYMPKGKMKLVQDYEILVSEYGSKNPEEFFCEAVSYHLSGTKLNKEVKELVSSLFKE